jgi:hypothetical protein
LAQGSPEDQQCLRLQYSWVALARRRGIQQGHSQCMAFFITIGAIKLVGGKLQVPAGIFVCFADCRTASSAGSNTRCDRINGDMCGQNLDFSPAELKPAARKITAMIVQDKAQCCPKMDN